MLNPIGRVLFSTEECLPIPYDLNLSTNTNKHKLFIDRFWTTPGIKPRGDVDLLCFFVPKYYVSCLFSFILPYCKFLIKKETTRSPHGSCAPRIMTVMQEPPSLIYHLTHYFVSKPCNNNPQRGSEHDALNVSHLSVRLWQNSTNASALEKFFTKKFWAKTEFTHLYWSVCAFSDF